jgi:nucleolar protein 56
MKLIIGNYQEGRLQPGFHETGDALTKEQLQELKGRFTKEYREANIRLTEIQLLQAATPDQDIIQAIHSLEQVDTVLNSLGKYTTEWYELHHPDYDAGWEQLAEKHIEHDGLREMNAGVQTILAVREQLKEHLEKQMRATLPNVTAVAGSIIGAKLLAAAGSKERLANFPSTTVQLLGAEQALFRHLRNKNALPPKYGILFNHPLVQAAAYKHKGKVARTLANNISIAARVDNHNGEFVGEELRKKVERQIHALTRS